MQNVLAEADVMALLKANTAEQHQNVERLMPFLRENFSISEYTQTLESFLGFFEPVEALLGSAIDWVQLGIDMNDRRRSALLRDDLRVMGLSDARIVALPRCTLLPSVQDRESALGCLYVLEGSTLGGQFIGRELGRRFNINESTGASFFLSHGSRVGAMWKEFCAVVRKYASEPVSQLRAAQAARETFMSLEVWMRKVNEDA